MLVRSRLAHLVCAGIAAPLLTVAVAGAAAAHGAPTDPVSRSAACGSEGKFTQTAACQAARAQGQWFDQWDNLRIADVNGRDRETIPDGKLCSGGLDTFRGLDLNRSDWPSAQVRAGKAITVSYRATIPHQGTFRMYVTKAGYDPKQPLRWADLESKPFLSATDPSFTGGSYSFKGTLPSGKVGRHVLYTIWQNSSTSDTYYSCSDVVFAKPAGSTKKPAAALTKAAKPATTAKPAKAAKLAKAAASAAGQNPTSAPTPSATIEVTPTGTPSTTAEVSLAAKKLSTEVAGDNSLLIPALAGVGLLALAGTGGAVAVTRRRRRPTKHRH